MSFKIHNHTGVLVKKAARLFEQVANKDLDKIGVTYAQTIFLIRLWERDGQSQMELAKSAGLKQPTVVRMLDRMERDALIKRVRNSEDQRVYNFYLTSKAKKICPKLAGHADIMSEISNQSLSKAEVNQLNELVIKVIVNLQQFLDA